MPSVYITASNIWSARYFKEFIQRHGGVVTSKWHDVTLPKRTSEMSLVEKLETTEDSFRLIKDSDYTLLIADIDMVPGGKFVDAGVAIGSGRRVIVVGRHENLKMYSESVTIVNGPLDLLKVLFP